MRNKVTKSMQVDGSILRNIYVPWVIKKHVTMNPSLLANKKVFFYTGMLQKPLINFFEEFSSRIYLADPYIGFKIPKLLTNSKSLDRFLKIISPLYLRKKISHKIVFDFSTKKIEENRFLSPINYCDIFVADNAQLALLNLNNLEGKTFIVDYLTAAGEKKLKMAGVGHIIACAPNIEVMKGLNFPTIEAIFQILKNDYTPIDHDDIFKWIEKFNLAPEVKQLQTTTEQQARFAFIIHPLSPNDLLRHPSLRPLRPLFNQATPLFEKAMTLIPGMHYGKIEGIKSDFNGKEIIGEIFTVFETPKTLLSSAPEKIYKKLEKITKQAAQMGAKIIGLGAYTKIVGDGGVTVAKRSPIPLTTGNSLSSAATLWAAAMAVEKMGFVKKNDQNIFQGRVMIVGATGSIGKVTSKLLAQSWSEIVVVAPKGHKVLELVDEIKQIASGCLVIPATKTDQYSSTCDLIITTTSAQGEKVLDIEKVKSGCVICDVSRPFDINIEDAIKRPDVLVIASGEVELPGVVKLTCDIGLQGNVVYACLAETALLCLEGRYENFTLSRNLNYEKVREIDQMARKHGVRLSAIMGHKLEITAEEIELCRRRALEIRNQSNLNNELENFDLIKNAKTNNEDNNEKDLLLLS
jgi:predicted amino acid dehydrogenase